MSFEAYLEEIRRQVDGALRERLGDDPALPERLREALAYTLLGPGKRIRAALVLTAADLFGGERGRLVPIACAVEMVHACSLILDDLPCMDDAATRRGRPSHHRVFGEEVSILAAVGLLNQAFRILAGERQGRFLRRRLDQALSLRLARAVGPDGMISGQFADLQERRPVEGLEALEYIHSRKTGRLFIASAEMGALAAGASAEGVEALGSFAKNLGLAFQITDDLLDHLGTEERLGKPVGSDSGKLTFVSLCGVEGARHLVDELIAAARRALAPFGERARRLLQMADFVGTRDR